MPQRIDVPGMGILEFPDGMTDAQIASAIKANAPRLVAQQRPSLPPEDTPGFGESALIGAGRTIDRVAKGMQQLYYGATGNQQALAALKTAAADDDKAYAPLREARPWATGIGEAAPSMVIPGGGASTLLGNVGRMALAGAVPGALEYGSAGDRLERAGIGAIGGAAVPALGVAAKTAMSAAEPLFQGGRDAIVGRLLNRVAGSEAPAVQQRLANAAPLVPGSMPTAAQVAENGGIAALQRSAQNANPQAYSQRAMEQAAARMQALRGIARDDAALAAAEGRRAAIGGMAYDRAAASGIDQGMAGALKPQIASLLERDEIQAAIKEAKSLAKSEGYDLGDNLGSVQGLQYLKQALDDRIAELPPNAKNKMRVWSQTSADLKSVLQDIAPDLRKADAVYARLSREPNRMQVGQALVNQMQGALGDYGGLASETGNRFAQALRNADAASARATGLKGSTAEKVLGPEQWQSVQSIAQDLARKSNEQRLGLGVGSNTAQNFAMQNIAAQSGMPRMVGGLLGAPGVNRAVSWVYRDTDQKVNDALAQAMLNPGSAADLMRRADSKALQDSPAMRRLLEQIAMRPGGLLASLLAPAPLLLQAP